MDYSNHVPLHKKFRRVKLNLKKFFFLPVENCALVRKNIKRIGITHTSQTRGTKEDTKFAYGNLYVCVISKIIAVI